MLKQQINHLQLNAGPDQTICVGDPIILDGSFGGSATSGTFYLVEDQGILIKKGVCPPPSNCNFQLLHPLLFGRNKTNSANLYIRNR